MKLDKTQTQALAAFAALVLCVVGANWALQTYGIVSIGFGLTAPAGVYFAGLTFWLRDMLHDTGGTRFVLAAIALGSLISWAQSDAVAIPGGVTSIAVASGIAFAASELADFAVYSPLRKRNRIAAIAASNTVGACLDSALFLYLAFGSLDEITGQVVGKSYMTLLAVGIVGVVSRNRISTGTA